jgi:hypothetical protein
LLTGRQDRSAVGRLAQIEGVEGDACPEFDPLTFERCLIRVPVFPPNFVELAAWRDQVQLRSRMSLRLELGSPAVPELFGAVVSGSTANWLWRARLSSFRHSNLRSADSASHMLWIMGTRNTRGSSTSRSPCSGTYKTTPGGVSRAMQSPRIVSPSGRRRSN